jgi:rhamnosyl/mannosyltransferase
MDDMRVLQFGKFYPPSIGGIERVMCDITEGLNSSGIRCDVLCSNETNRFVDGTVNGYRVVRTRSYGVYLSTSLSPQLTSKLREMHKHYDIIHAHLPDPMANVALRVVNPGAGLVLHWHNDIIRQKALLRFYLPLQTWMLKRADAIITTSPNYIDGSAYLSPFRHKCHVVPIGVDVEDIRSSPSTVARIKDKFQGKRIVFAIGRLSEYKGYKYLIEAGGHLGDDYVILIAGSGPLKHDLGKRIAQRRLQDRVFLLGPIRHEDVGSYYEACDVFCLSSVSRNEGFGLVQLEAMLFRKPVVSTRVPGSGITWANLDGETGLVVEPRDPAALARAIDRICSDADLYARLAAGGFKRVTGCFTKGQMLSSTLEVYRTVRGVVGGGGRDRF